MPNTDMTKVGKDAPLVAMPEHMKGAPIVGVDRLKELITPPMVKIVQSSADPDLKKQFGVGTVIQTPDNIVICTPLERDDKTGEIVKHGSFVFTPIYYYKDWIKWAPMKSKGVLPAILGRSTDINSDIARKAMNAQTRLEDLDGENKKFGQASLFLPGTPWREKPCRPGRRSSVGDRSFRCKDRWRLRPSPWCCPRRPAVGENGNGFARSP